MSERKSLGWHFKNYRIRKSSENNLLRPSNPSLDIGKQTVSMNLYLWPILLLHPMLYHPVLNHFWRSFSMLFLAFLVFFCHLMEPTRAKIALIFSPPPPGNSSKASVINFVWEKSTENQVVSYPKRRDLSKSRDKFPIS